MISKLFLTIFDVNLFKFRAIDKRIISLLTFVFPLWWNLLYDNPSFILEKAPSDCIDLFILSSIPYFNIIFLKEISLYFWNVSDMYIPFVCCPSIFQ